MKKILALVLAALMLVACVACGNKTNDETTIENDVTEAPAVDTEATEDNNETEAPADDTEATEDNGENEEFEEEGDFEPEVVEPVTGAHEILLNVWASYAEDEMFFAAGGYGDTMNWSGAGHIPTDDEEAILTAQTYFVMTEEAIAMVDEIAHIMHGMIRNNFTAGVFHLKADADKDAFIASVTDSVTNNHWSCGFPEKFVVITVGDYIITAYGLAGITDPMADNIGNFVKNVKACYETAEVVVEESL